MNIKDEMFSVTEALAKSGIDYALCGGMALIVHGYPRATRDIDLLIREVDLASAEQTLADVGYQLTSGIIPFDVGKPTERRIFRVTKTEGQDFLTLDLVLVSPFLADVWDDREIHRVGERTLCVVSRRGLGKMKRAANRPQDVVELQQLGIEG